MGVPGYPPGFPLLLALAGSIGGEQAAFAVVPLSAAGLIIVAFMLGRRLGGPDTALIAAAAVGASPILIFQSLQPMSDVPAAFWWSLAVLLLTHESNRMAAFGGARRGDRVSGASEPVCTGPASRRHERVVGRLDARFLAASDRLRGAAGDRCRRVRVPATGHVRWRDAHGLWASKILLDRGQLASAAVDDAAYLYPFLLQVRGR